MLVEDVSLMFPENRNIIKIFPVTECCNTVESMDVQGYQMPTYACLSYGANIIIWIGRLSDVNDGMCRCLICLVQIDLFVDVI